ncbi:MAG: hypothetical protein LBT04_07645 [Prevotellaceae bacterium]|jgi:hypothetical protein|nr:hypothetical protein [Prevotellaceae bacterium]
MNNVSNIALEPRLIASEAIHSALFTWGLRVIPQRAQVPAMTDTFHTILIIYITNFEISEILQKNKFAQLKKFTYLCT